MTKLHWRLKMMEDLGDGVENSYISNNAVGARQRRTLNGNSYSTIPTQVSSSYDADGLKRKSTSFGAPSLNALSQKSNLFISLFQSTAHLTEGPNKPYYQDNYNDSSWNLSCGTAEDDGVWMNSSDSAGTIMAVLVWLLLGYSAWTFVALAVSGGVPAFLSDTYVVLCVLALASHAKTTLTDPGSVPQAAVPNERMRMEMGTPDHPLSMCSQCQTFKPPFSHHCRICNRCISRMDHRE